MGFLLLPLPLFLLVGGGWVLGFAGFVRAGRALAEISRLRAELALGQAAPPGASAPSRAVAPPVPADGLSPSLPPPPPERIDIEELLTLRWGVWLGAVALLLAGVFLVRYAIDEGLLGPGPRCVLAGLLGLALIGGAEWLRRRPASAATADQAPPALAAGGVAVLFGAAYAAGVLYALVPAPAGFVLMAAAPLAGLALSLRMGRLVAAVGLAGAFVTPLLVQTHAPSMPGLFGYLLFVMAAALAVVRHTAWTWLGWATALAGVAWVLLAAATGAPDIWAPALFVPAASLLNLVLLPPAALDHPAGARLAWVPFGALGAAGLLLTLLVPGTATWAAVLLLAPLAVGKAAREPRLDRLTWLAALLFLLLVLGWGLPAWRPAGEAVTAGGVVQAVLPGTWTPDALRPLLGTAALMAAFFAGSGLWFERRTADPLRWSALPAAVPVLTLAVAYARVEAFQPDALWAGTALLLAAGLTATAGRALAGGGRPRAGVHAAGATAALALGCAMLLTTQWLTLAVALFLPALAWVEAQADLQALRRVALAVAGLVLVRLVLNWYALDYAAGQPPVLNALLIAYLAPGLAFALAARTFLRRADDLLVAVLEGGSAAFLTILVALEIRHFATGGSPASPAWSFWEAALQVSALALLATVSLRLAQRTGRVVLGWVWQVQGALALLGGTLLLVANPAFLDGNPVGRLPLLDALLAAYALPALLAVLASRTPGPSPAQRRVLAVYAFAAAFAWITLEVRYLFHPAAIGFGEAPVLDAELWAWSGTWLAFGLALMAGGIRGGLKPLRLAALAVVALAGVKIFLVDMRDLVGLWRVLSFLGLGLALIGLGTVHRRFVVEPKQAA